MSRDDFERLINDWIDQPDQPALCRAIESTVRRVPEAARIRDQWQRLVTGLRSLPQHGPAPDSLRSAIRAAIADE